MVLYVVLPAFVFIDQLLLRKPVPLPAHVGEAKMAAAVDIFFQGDGSSGTELIQNINKERIIDGGFALHHSIIVIENQAGIFQHMVTILWDLDLGRRNRKHNSAAFPDHNKHPAAHPFEGSGNAD